MIVIYWVTIISGATGFFWCATFVIAGIGELAGLINGMGIFFMGLIITIPGMILSYLIANFALRRLLLKNKIDFTQNNKVYSENAFIFLFPRSNVGIITFTSYIFVHWFFALISQLFPTIARRIGINPQNIYPKTQRDHTFYFVCMFLSALAFFFGNSMLINFTFESPTIWFPGLFFFWIIIFGAPCIALLKKNTNSSIR